MPENNSLGHDHRCFVESCRVEANEALSDRDEHCAEHLRDSFADPYCVSASFKLFRQIKLFRRVEYLSQSQQVEKEYNSSGSPKYHGDIFHTVHKFGMQMFGRSMASLI